MGKASPMVFISYAKEDIAFAKDVKRNLEAANFKVWMDENMIQAGDEWRNKIDMAISDSFSLIVILTPESYKSLYVTYEWAYAKGKKKKITPILHKPSPNDIHPRLTALHYIDFTGTDVLPWQLLVTDISEKANAHSIEESTKAERDKHKVSTLQHIDAIISLAHVKAKNAGRHIKEGDITEASKQISKAISLLEQSNSKIKRILWVDDRPEKTIHEREAFSALNFKLELASSTNEALQKLNNKKYDAVISDMRRSEGEKEGYVLLELFRQRDKSTPFFIYTGWINNFNHNLNRGVYRKKQGLHGCTDSPEELIHLVIKHIRRNNHKTGEA